MLALMVRGARWVAVVSCSTPTLLHFGAGHGTRFVLFVGSCDCGLLAALDKASSAEGALTLRSLSDRLDASRT